MFQFFLATKIINNACFRQTRQRSRGVGKGRRETRTHSTNHFPNLFFPPPFLRQASTPLTFYPPSLFFRVAMCLAGLCKFTIKLAIFVGMFVYLAKITLAPVQSGIMTIVFGGGFMWFWPWYVEAQREDVLKSMKHRRREHRRTVRRPSTS